MKKIGITAAALLVALCGWLVAGQEAERDEEESGLRTVLQVLEVLGGDLVTPSKAVAAATRARPGAPVEIEMEVVRKDGADRVVWEVEILADGRLGEVLVDAKSGEVLGSESDGDEDEAEESGEAADLLGGAKVSLADALDRVAKNVEGLVISAEIDDEDDLPGNPTVWEVILLHGGRGHEVMIHGTSGKLVLEAGDDDHEEDEED